MQTQAQTRKRPAPGTSPPTQQQPQQNPYTDFQDVSDPSQLSNDQFIQWGADSNQTGFADPSNYASNIFPAPIDQNASNQLVRRNVNNELMARGQPFAPGGSEFWNYEQEMPPGWDEYEDDAELEKRAAAAKREAQSKRPPKQIPPFIQKLSSFLDNNHNTDLIRWSDDGNSFIVLDEDGFAKQLIPELFKHDKYASFVRQLNMYGFHKKVGLSDNSMRASEKKARSPSEYYNPYFKRGRPELLWLIQKPKNETVTSKKKGKGAKNEDDHENVDETKQEDDIEQDIANQANSNTDLITLPKSQLASLQQEVRGLQRSQQQISTMLARLRDENNQYIRQASALVVQHERHENSINAILTFLATFYNRNLQGQGNFPNLFGNILSNNQPQGNVVDVGDYEDTGYTPTNEPQRPARRPLALLPAPETVVTEVDSPQSTPTMRQSSTTQASRQNSRPTNLRAPSNGSSARSSPTPNVRDASNSPATPVNPNNGEIMNVIKNANANANTSSSSDPSSDFNNALNQFQNDGRGPLTPQQRDSMLSLMGAGAGNANNLANPLGSTGDESKAYLDQLQGHQDHLDRLQRLQREQDSKVQDLADRLQPLSPSGSIPGLHAPGSSGSQSWEPNYEFDFGNYLDLGNDFLNEYPYDGLDLNAADGGAAGKSQGKQGADDGQVKEEDDDDEGDDSSLFADGDQDLDDSDGEGGGKVLGSVGENSNAPTPKQQPEQEEDESGPRRSKRQRVG